MHRLSDSVTSGFSACFTCFDIKHFVYINMTSLIHCAVVWNLASCTYVVGPKSFRPNQLFKVTEIKQLCHFSTQSPFISTHFSTDTLTSPQIALYTPYSIFHLDYIYITCKSIHCLTLLHAYVFSTVIKSDYIARISNNINRTRTYSVSMK